MNGLQEIHDELFLDIQNIIEELNDISSIDDLLQKEKLIRELSEKTNFLKLSEAFGLNQILNKPQVLPVVSVVDEQEIFEVTEDDNVEEPSQVENVENEATEDDIQDDDLDLIDNQILAEAHQEEIVETENVEDFDKTEEIENVDHDDEVENDHLDLSDNEMLKDDDTEHDVEELAKDEENLVKEKEASLNNESTFSFAMDSVEESKVETVEEPSLVSEISVSEDANEVKENLTETISKSEELVSESSVKIEDTKDEISDVEEEKKSLFDTEKSNADDNQNSKKIKLSNIKGIHKTLFDNDPLERIQASETTSEPKNSGSLGKSNMPTDYMEAPKPKPEFRLDLNDKIAFTQHLFKNSQVELNQVVHKLNEFDNIDDAKEFLSDLYYDRNWEKADSYAQRLWTLVENRFL
ncbi:hypothetical protein [Soonwooa sp.]|uniref:hypothetical protein n=1 Tax=Soonwooa sp. TaxID=1938592 RepID=UPI002898DBBD|nr:hypothetical protein [Soonwooa sp.]